MGGEQLLRLRPVTAPDLALLVDWVEQPHVSRWWHDPVGRAEIEANYLPRVRGEDPTHALIVELDGEPIGFAQWYHWADYPDYGGKLGAIEDEAGMDYLIGAERHCGYGVGTRLVAALLDLVRLDWPAVGGVVVDPEIANQASRRVLEKNGLRLGLLRPDRGIQGLRTERGVPAEVQCATSVARDSRTTVTLIWPG